MVEDEVRKILDERIKPNGSLQDPERYLSWKPGNEKATLDASFTADELEAIAWWMRNKGGTS